MREIYTLTIKTMELEKGEQVRCIYNDENCNKEYQVYVIIETENSKSELYLCGFHFALESCIFHTTALVEASKKVKVI